MAYILFADDGVPAQPPFTASHHAQSIADLIMPVQIERTRELCTTLATTVEAETTAMFGPAVDFYQLSRRSARALVMALERRAAPRNAEGTVAA